jgi:hypothetical protein
MSLLDDWFEEDFNANNTRSLWTGSNNTETGLLPQGEYWDGWDTAFVWEPRILPYIPLQTPFWPPHGSARRAKHFYLVGNVPLKHISSAFLYVLVCNSILSPPE